MPTSSCIAIGLFMRATGIANNKKESKMFLIDIENRLQQISIDFLVGHFF